MTDPLHYLLHRRQVRDEAKANSARIVVQQLNLLRDYITYR